MKPIYIEPKFLLERYTCPLCNTLSRQYHKASMGDVENLDAIYASEEDERNQLGVTHCEACDGISIWIKKKLIYPRKSLISIPTEDMPNNVQQDYIEASDILNDSPRGAAALLRLAMQKLCIELGEKGGNINDDIGELVKKGLSKKIQKALDIVRVIGNESVHPGQIDMKDNKEIAIELFKLVNIIVETQISQPKRIDELYESLPETKKQQIEKRDKK